MRVRSALGELRARAFAAPVTRGNVQMHWPEANPLIARGVLDQGGLVPDYNARRRTREGAGRRRAWLTRAPPVAGRKVLRLRADGGDSSALDAVAVEEPLEIRVAGETLAVTMRTPGDDHELALGLLLSEGVIAAVADVGRVFHCGRPGDADFGNVDRRGCPAPASRSRRKRIERARRGTLTSAACGVCGRKSIDDLLARCARAAGRAAAARSSLLRSCTDVLRQQQRNFDVTGGLHAAAILTADARVLAVREDVGRHNAVDKAIGALFLQGTVPVADPSTRASATAANGETPVLLVVSGRISFEIVQKAVAARIVAIAASPRRRPWRSILRSAAARRLAAFVRNGSLNLYCGDERVIGD